MTIFGIRVMRERTYQSEQEYTKKLLIYAEHQIDGHRENKDFWMHQAQSFERELAVNKNWPHNNRITVLPSEDGQLEIEVRRS